MKTPYLILLFMAALAFTPGLDAEMIMLAMMAVAIGLFAGLHVSSKSRIRCRFCNNMHVPRPSRMTAIEFMMTICRREEERLVRTFGRA
jgi:hypothetical protein